MTRYSRIRTGYKKIRSAVTKIVGRKEESAPEGFEVCPDWISRISIANLTLLQRSNGHHGQRLSPEILLDSSWKLALCALGAALYYDHGKNLDALRVLERYYALHVDTSGEWLTSIERVESSMKGYTLLVLTENQPNRAFVNAADALVKHLVVIHPRMIDGSLPYHPSSQEILVDTLAMICPFLARYANLRGNEAARQVSVQQLQNFIAHSVDAETHLPYHGYYADGPKHLGLHGWGRGTGWYMLGLVDTLAELAPTHPAYEALLRAFRLAAEALRIYQRPDGHWNWAILHRRDTLDSSTTALIGYSLMRGLMLGLLDSSFEPVITGALRALAAVTRADGILDFGLGECRGLGKYPQTYGPQPWLQGAATAFAVLYFKHFEGRAV